MPTGAFNICCPRDCISLHNGGTSGAPLKPLRVDSALRALSTLRDLRAERPLCRGKQSLGQQILNVTVGINGLKEGFSITQPTERIAPLVITGHRIRALLKTSITWRQYGTGWFKGGSELQARFADMQDARKFEPENSGENEGYQSSCFR